MSRAPGSTIPHHGVEDREQLPHARHQCHLLGLARRKELLVELLEDGVMPDGDQRPHVQRRPYRCPPAPHFPLAFEGAGVAVEGCDADQRREAPVIERAELGQLGQQCSRQGRTHARYAPEERLILLPDSVLLDHLVEILVGPLQLLLEPLNVCPDAPGHRFGGNLEAVVLGDEHLQELASSGEDRLQSLGFLVGKDARTRAYCGRQTGEYFGVYLVGLGQPTGGFGEVSGLAGVYDRNGDLYRSYGSRRGALVTTACFEDDQRRGCLEEPIEEGLDTCLVVGDDEVIALWYEANVEALFGDVYADVGSPSGAGSVAHGATPSSSDTPGLADTGLPSKRAAALTTVRAPPSKVRTRRPVLSGGLSEERRPRRYRSVASHRPHSERPKPRYKEVTTMMFGELILVLLVLGVVVWAIIKVFPDWQNRIGLDRQEDSAEETLRQRFARGEIDAEEYERSLEVLRSGRVSEYGTMSEKGDAK